LTIGDTRELNMRVWIIFGGDERERRRKNGKN